MSIYDSLNPQQKDAALHTEGPLLILAGAGSGKTRVLTHRIAYLIGEKGVNPWNILAITFTNKAANEMRERVDGLVGGAAREILVSTFHSACVRILRRYIDRLGYDRNFAIYDADDQLTVMKGVFKSMGLNPKQYRERAFLSAISSAKDECVSAREFEESSSGDIYRSLVAASYREYERRLRANNALDFDDLLVKTVTLFRENQDILEAYQERFRYISVDEYQDTNTAQFQMVSLLAGKYRNLCVVGDDDQSIYKFRGANIRNILDFEKVFPDAYVVRLEQNYRSTGNILTAANAVIANNTARKEKRLWTSNGDGDRIKVVGFPGGKDEAGYVAEDISEKVARGGRSYGDFAVLYRTNAQSRLFEERFVAGSIPYKIVGGVNFYSRREVKDLLAYLKVINNASDDLAARRIINVPRRGIGNTTIDRIQEYADRTGRGFFDALTRAGTMPGVTRGLAKINEFVEMMDDFKEKSGQMPPSRLLSYIMDKTGYEESLRSDDEEEYEKRKEYIGELINKAASYEAGCEQEPTLSGFLEDVALVADIDSLSGDGDYVTLMTLHSAKGLEFPEVFLVGMEDGMFPSGAALYGADREEIEEERRLCYVGITRAREDLTLTFADERMVNGSLRVNDRSMFIDEIPPEVLDEKRERGSYRGKKSYYFPENEYGGGYGVSKSGRGRSTAGGGMTISGPGGFVGGKDAEISGAGYIGTYVGGENIADRPPAKSFGVKDGVESMYKPGDRVRSRKYGEGVVTAVTEGGRDYELTVKYDSGQTRKVFAKFANLERL